MELLEIGKAAKQAVPYLNRLTTEEKNKALLCAADALVTNADVIIEANAVDIEAAKANNMPAGLVDRLLLTKERIEAMAVGLRQIVDLDDPIGEVIDRKSVV